LGAASDLYDGIERGEHNLTIQTALRIAGGLAITAPKLLLESEKQIESPPAPSQV
jgi:transcriptional regulator with XRE-family HTH domain